MSKTLAPDEIIGVLEALGLEPERAATAAHDARIAWTPAALDACAYDIEHSGMNHPDRALWSRYLQHGNLPPLPKIKRPPAEPEVERIPCPIGGPPCFGDLSICNGVHGYAATLDCVQCHRPLMECRGHCEPMQPKARRTTRNRKESAA